MSPVLELCDIGKTYYSGDNKTQVLSHINLQIFNEDTLSIMGASGSGKSTLMNIIGLLDRPTTGDYFLLGEEVENYKDDDLAKLRNQTIGFVFQSFFLLPRLTALENVGLPLTYRGGLSHAEIEARSMMMLEKVGMEHRAKHRPNQLSGGQQQRVAIARALVGQPTIILADEPTGALDSKTSQEVLELLLRLDHEDHAATIIVTHDEKVAQQCQRIVHIRDGLLVG